MNRSEISAAGFAAAKRSPRRLIASIQGPVKSGKTRLALTAKKPCGYIAVEIGGEEGVVDQFIKDGVESSDDILVAPIRMDSPAYPAREEFGNTKDGERDYQDAISEAVQAVAGPALGRFEAAYYASLANCATTIVDTGSDFWEIARLANFGRLEKIPQLAYGQLNKSIDRLLDDAKSYPGSTIWVHHMAEKWESYTDDKGKERQRPSGIFDMAGYKGIKKKVQTVIETWREDLQEPDEETGLMVRFGAAIIDSRHSPMAMGKRFKDFDITFQDIGMAVIPNSSRSDWE